MQEAGIDLCEILREEGFLAETRRLSGDGATRVKRTAGLGVIGRCPPPLPPIFPLCVALYDNAC